MNHTLLSSPLQGFTDYKFRNAFQKYFGGIDTFYAPYIKLNGKLEIKKSYERDLLPENNTSLELIPQIITNDADEFLFVAKFVQELGYKELNWNLGCPYPMVTKRGMGSGLICDFAKIEQILQKVYDKSDITVSMKMRMGYENSNEILATLPILAQFPLKNIAIHARIGKQLYKGGVDLDAFERCIENTNHKLYYNGDITSVAVFDKMQQRFPSIDHWLIGRGLIADPFLPSMIKNNTQHYPANKIEIFKDFHQTIFEQYEASLSGAHHILLKMTSFWEYFATHFTDPHKTFKKIKKSKSLKAYHLAVQEILNDEKRR
ncbi:tRNA-dihydrouridine synthase family protein [Lutibacter sp. HS1-25]|uniref:tRNA dihydrouridine synthase n=1 Tax=Lutibacter sp. HS1-25 TaxID=2485000 RepID=UPI001011B48D|nr:tRNA-dihydrouridine synthase family protein [Lutibacter sp. HS1-25]RXP47094.1 tRNA-dihydrouridine synthase family protein [Lutibacter sp. HS1-25]RXP51184.1 tRNA-dihydrouridine synthase family protein [Lutibacter sp. HS1-25]RXP51187.1 tRNA-dihydrouridine synthase family protein [Lutibacter sp. HS1-25]